ncbi:hypothetical protein CSPHI_00385 [Corynebacterium sphenisci DSM 44792]|uniref:Uncharacterized protein n=1 Tax=Corynebacterium sphenisci DSM 44792 TaxID=1437874 RepID=A0A1L7CVB1_9CORY|nr:hypothetical protein [Corynebacterium sphenisci]APT89806.1 hypothetical protein CSPHI_00385 [Corynebacterium sphenisci DSM 44792]
MFGFLRKKKAPQTYIAAERTNTPLSPELTRMVAEELPLLDSTSRARVYEILREHTGPVITEQADLPEELRRMLDLD